MQCGGMWGCQLLCCQMLPIAHHSNVLMNSIDWFNSFIRSKAFYLFSFLFFVGVRLNGLNVTFKLSPAKPFLPLVTLFKEGETDTLSISRLRNYRAKTLHPRLCHCENVQTTSWSCRGKHSSHEGFTSFDSSHVRRVLLVKVSCKCVCVWEREGLMASKEWSQWNIFRGVLICRSSVRFGSKEIKMFKRHEGSFDSFTFLGTLEILTFVLKRWILECHLCVWGVRRTWFHLFAELIYIYWWTFFFYFLFLRDNDDDDSLTFDMENYGHLISIPDISIYPI